MTVCFLLRGEPEGEVLLGLKKVRFGAGKYAGIGGGVEPGESPQQAAVRELEEETGVRVQPPALTSRGHVTFLFPDRPAWNQTVHIFTATEWEGDPRETEEMRPAWFPIHQLPLDRMWQDAALWLPRVLAGQIVQIECIFGADNETVVEVQEKAS